MRASARILSGRNIWTLASDRLCSYSLDDSTGRGEREACRPRPEKAEESFVASSERSFFPLSWTQIDGKGEVGIGKYGAEALSTTDAGGPKNNELAFKAG